jgi:hypothetical protein
MQRSTCPPNNSLEATWDAPRFACGGANLLIWRARVGESPGASARGRYAFLDLNCDRMDRTLLFAYTHRLLEGGC